MHRGALNNLIHYFVISIYVCVWVCVAVVAD